jgi:hypothetical protein
MQHKCRFRRKELLEMLMNQAMRKKIAEFITGKSISSDKKIDIIQYIIGNECKKGRGFWDSEALP